MARNTDRIVPENIASIIIIWYMMAVIGELPLKICPVIIPGSDTSPIVAMVAIVGLADLFNAR